MPDNKPSVSAVANAPTLADALDRVGLGILMATPTPGEQSLERPFGWLKNACDGEPTTDAQSGFLASYEILEHLGRGGMGDVRKGKHKKLFRTVAIKTLRRELGKDPRFSARFHEEAKSLAAIQHPNIVAIYDFGAASDGQLYLIMEFVAGKALRQTILQGPLPRAMALKLMVQICSGMAVAHELGIIHRDIKPENILLDATGNAKVADFGLARSESSSSNGVTGPTDVMGSLKYMAPEQKMPGAKSGPSTDVFSLGLIFYELLTGTVPEGAFEPVSSRAGVPTSFDEIINRCLQADPSRRFASAGHLLTALERLELRPSPRIMDRRYFIPALCAMSSVVAGGLALMIWHLFEQQRVLADFLKAKVTGPAGSSENIIVELPNGKGIQISVPASASPLKITFTTAAGSSDLKISDAATLSLQCTSSEPLKISFALSDGEGTRDYAHPKSIPKDEWDFSLDIKKLGPPTGDPMPDNQKEIVLTITRSPNCPPGEATMTLTKLALVK